MARRSAQNPRYRKDAQVGSTRRSASSAKPKREAGEAGSSGGKASGSKGSSAKGKPSVPFEPDTPEFKRWRKIWLGLLLGAVVFSVGAWFGKETPAGSIGLVLAYAALFGALWIDFTKIRRMRKEWREEHADGKGKPAKTAKSDKAEKTAKTEKSEDKKGDV